MSLTDSSYVTSPSGQNMLQMVTAGFYNNSSIAQWIFQVLGQEWDEMSYWTQELYQEIFPQTCTWSIDWWEWHYGVTSDSSLSLETRRQRLLAHMMTRAPINPEVLRSGVASLTGCPLVEITDFSAPYSFWVTVPHEKPIETMGMVWSYLHTIKPSHLSFRLFFVMETPVDTTLHLSNLETRVEETTLPFLDKLQLPNTQLSLGGNTSKIAEVTMDEVVGLREISTIVNTATIHSSTLERTSHSNASNTRIDKHTKEDNNT